MSNEDNTKYYENIILSGGGVKGLAYIGMLEYIENTRILKNIKEYVGCSIGAFACLTFILGYRSKDLKKIIDNINLEDMLEYKFSNFFDDYGLDNGKKIEKFIKLFIKTKSFDENITFKQLFEKIPINFVITVTNLNIHETEFISKDNYPDMPVYLAVKMSICVPFFFKPVKYNNILYVDGGITCNFPIRYYLDKKDKYSKILSFSFNKIDNDNYPIDSFYSYISSIFHSAKFSMENTDIITAKRNNIDIVLISVNIKKNQSMDMSLSRQAIYSLYSSGYESIKNFIENGNKKFKKNNDND